MWWRSHAPAAGERKHIRRASSSWIRSSLVAVFCDGDDVAGFAVGLLALSGGVVGGLCCSSSSLPSSMMVSEL